MGAAYPAWTPGRCFSPWAATIAPAAADGGFQAPVFPAVFLFPNGTPGEAPSWPGPPGLSNERWLLWQLRVWKERGLGQGQKAVYSYAAAENQPYTLEVRAMGNKFTFRRNGILMGSWTDPYGDLNHGYLGFDAANHTHFDNVRVSVP